VSPRTRGVLLAATTALCWAVLAIALKFSLTVFSSGTVVWCRMAIAFALLFTYMGLSNPRSVLSLRRATALSLFASVAIASNYFAFLKGIELTTASNAQIMIQMAPLSFAVLSLVLFKERLSWLQGFGLLTAFLGFAFFYWDQILVSWEELAQFQIGNQWLAVAVVSWTLFALAQKVLLRTMAPLEFNLIVFAVATLVLFPMATPQELLTSDWLHTAVLLFLGLNTVVAYVALSAALLLIPSSHVSVIIAVNPLLTVALMTALTESQVTWIKGEPVHWRGLVGAVFVVLGVILTVRKPRRLSQAR
jgi:drug/metabolite transporter (DMT)-like permease